MFVHFDEELYDSFLTFKYSCKEFKSFTLLNKKPNSKIGRWSMVPNGIGGLVVDWYNHDYIRISNMEGYWSCGDDVKPSYNGDDFFIRGVNLMPFCSNVLIDDWISVYKSY